MKPHFRSLRILAFLLLPACAFGLLMNFEPKSTNFERYTSDEDTIKPATTPALMVQDDKGVSHPVRLHTLNVSVTVVGNIARTTMDMTFYNDEKRILEGELYFPLGEGQTVSRFALEIDGKLRDGVVVEKEKGQQVFESVVRQNIDPGLLEWTQGNNFKARVYPIPSKGYKRIVLAYEQELNVMDQNYLYTLPMDYKTAIPNFSFEMEAIARPAAPVNDPESPVKMEFAENEGTYRANFERTNFLPGKGLRIGLPWPKNKLAIFTEKVLGSDGDYYYYVSLEPRKMSGETKRPQHIAVIWDASSSAEKRSTETDLRLLEAFIKESGVREIDLYALRNELTKVDHFTISGGNADQLVAQIQSLKPDGASAYRSIDYSKIKAESILLFGDGLSNFGIPQNPEFHAPVYTVNSANSANHSYLRFIASASGGAYINLTNTEFRNAVQQMQGQNMLYLGNNQENSYPSLPVTINDQIQVAGIIHGVTEIDFRFGSGENEQVEHLRIDPEKHLSETGILRRIWAQKKLAELDIYPEENSEAITALGKEYGLVTRNTSLIVLDRLEDYVRHEIVPPAEMQTDYFAEIDAQKKEKEQQRIAHMETVKANFAEYVAWWNKPFPKEKPVVQTDTLELYQLESMYSVDHVSEELNAVGAVSGESDARFDRLVNAPEAEKKEKGNKTDKVEIQLAAWTPDAPYLEPLKKLKGEELYAKYLKLKTENGNTPSFYLDVADVFIEAGDEKIALRILSNIAELELENHELLRILAHRLEQLKYYDLAVEVFNTVLRLRKEEPQSYRDLGLCLEKTGEFQRAIEMLYAVALNEWDGRFPDIEGIALVEMNHIISRHAGLNTTFIDKDLLQDLPVDVRIILTWDTDNCDMDLWVTDPYEEKCFYSHKLTAIGGRMSNDFTGGYGPEMFTLKQAVKGNYKVQINYYGSRSQKANGPTTIQMKLITNYGRPNEEVQEITRRLTETKEILDIGELIFQ